MNRLPFKGLCFDCGTDLKPGVRDDARVVDSRWGRCNRCGIAQTVCPEYEFDCPEYKPHPQYVRLNPQLLVTDFINQ